MNRTYTELIKLTSFKERFCYLQIHSSVGLETFGSKRYLNQRLYSSAEWKKFRDGIIIRDQGKDLAMPFDNYSIGGHVYIHHLNPITESDILSKSSAIFDPENVVCVSFNTHQAIHYGSYEMLFNYSFERSRNDMCPWKR